MFCEPDGARREKTFLLVARDGARFRSGVFEGVGRMRAGFGENYVFDGVARWSCIYFDGRASEREN